MSYLHHIRACNAHDLGRFRPFFVAGQRIGRVRHELAERLPELSGAFAVRPDRVDLAAELTGFDERSQAVAKLVEALVDDGTIPKLRGEDYPAVTGWGQPPLFRIDRVAVPYFGIRAYGIHVNGFVRRPDGLHMWIGRRSSDRTIAPGKLDHLVAGGQPYGLSLAENLLKEAKEEADLGPDLVRAAVPVGAVSYLLENEAGLKPDTLFVYDLECPAGFVPRNTDGEVAEFRLLPLDEVARIVRETDDFKFNVSLVVIDFLIRHGWLKPEEPDYVALALGLRRSEAEE